MLVIPYQRPTEEKWSYLRVLDIQRHLSAVANKLMIRILLLAGLTVESARSSHHFGWAFLKCLPV